MSFKFRPIYRCFDAIDASRNDKLLRYLITSDPYEFLSRIVRLVRFIRTYKCFINIFTDSSGKINAVFPANGKVKKIVELIYVLHCFLRRSKRFLRFSLKLTFTRNRKYLCKKLYISHVLTSFTRTNYEPYDFI